MRICIISDVHLDRITCGKSRFDDIWMSVLGPTLGPKYDLLLFLGDWADPDNSRSLRSSEYAVKYAKLLDKTPSIWITGNHDVTEDGFGTSVLSPLKASGIATVVDSPTVIQTVAWDFQLVALPYTPRVRAYDPGEFVKEAAAKLNPRKQTIVIGHLDLEGITPGSEITEMPRGRQVFWPLREIAEHIPNAKCFGGHIHNRSIFEKDGCTVHVVGSLSRLSFSEEKNTPGYHTFRV